MDKSYYRKLSGDLCYLSPICLEDAPRYVEWLNDPEVSVNLLNAHQIISLPGERDWIERAARQNEVFAIVDSATDQLIGNCGLHNVNHVDGIAECGIFIGDKAYWNRGYGTEALSLLLDFAFNLQNLRNVKLDVYEFNQRAIRCYEKCGFKQIGRRRKARTIGGSHYDVIYMDIIAEEFRFPSKVTQSLPGRAEGE